tara:strand:+ start:725 stop:1054 length:330 start_codon:yes stop_codon:yes gene_type:complete
MNKPSSLIWVVLILLLILPTPAGKFITDLVGGIFLIITLVPLILMGFGWIAWKKLQANLQTCEACGSSFLNTQVTCPICGTPIRVTKDNLSSIPASAATIDIKSEDINI